MSHQNRDWTKYTSGKTPTTNPNPNNEYVDDGNVPAITLAAIDAMKAAEPCNSNEQESGVSTMLNKTKEAASNAVENVKDTAKDIANKVTDEVKETVSDRSTIKNASILFCATVLGSLAGSLIYGLINNEK